MARASGLAAEVYASEVPLLSGALELAAAGFVSGGTRANTTHLRDVVTVSDQVSADVAVVLHDAQTSGGLLLAMPQGRGDLIDDLRSRDLVAAVVGRVVDGPAGRITVHSERPL
jgi:selenide,water dikinase